MSSYGGASPAFRGGGPPPRRAGTRGFGRRRARHLPSAGIWGVPIDSTTARDDRSESSTPRAPSPALHGAGHCAVPPPVPFPPLALSPPVPTPPASPASAADAGATDRCLVASCGVTAVDNFFWVGVRVHLRDGHKAVDVATAVLPANRLRGCPHCGERFLLACRLLPSERCQTTRLCASRARGRPYKRRLLGVPRKRRRRRATQPRQTWPRRHGRRPPLAGWTQLVVRRRCWAPAPCPAAARLLVRAAPSSHTRVPRTRRSTFPLASLRCSSYGAAGIATGRFQWRRPPRGAAL